MSNLETRIKVVEVTRGKCTWTEYRPQTKVKSLFGTKWIDLVGGKSTYLHLEKHFLLWYFWQHSTEGDFNIKYEAMVKSFLQWFHLPYDERMCTRVEVDKGEYKYPNNKEENSNE